MKKLLKGALVAALLVPGATWAQGIRNSRHDLSNTSTSPLKNTSVTANDICVYCHTPHRAQSTQLSWNHSQTAVATFSWGNDLNGTPLTKTTAGTPLPTTLKGASKICLGCHDGSVALGDVSNIGGGSAGVVAGLASIVGFTDATGKLIDAAKLVGNLGNLGGNHPVSIPYAGQTGYNGLSSTAIADGAIGNYYAVATVGCTSPSGVCTAAPATDGRNGAAINLVPNTPGGTTNLGIECSSCHDPHNKFGFPFLTRVDPTNASGLCRSCHNK